MSYYDLSAGEDDGCDGYSSSSSEDCEAEWGECVDKGNRKSNMKHASDSIVMMDTPSGLPSTFSNRNRSNSNANSYGKNDGRDPLWGRSIVHLDIDCFYCQCEEIDRELRSTQHQVDGENDGTGARATPDPIRPLAIGQKHIIVTCNYEARKYGVKKLQSRDAARLACPELMIVEGSDLRQYRRHSRAVYDSFRKAVLKIARAVTGEGDDDDDDKESNPILKRMSDDELSRHVPARKGTMDEMMVDLSYAVDSLLRHQHGRLRGDTKGSDEHLRLILGSDHLVGDPGWFIFGEGAASSVANLVDDQTGATTTVSFAEPSVGLSQSRRNVHESYRSGDRQSCQQRLHIAARLAMYICETIRQETGFFTTVGISVSPLLAKLASGLNKPKSINMLYPWRSSVLLYGMPLRKMNNVGYKTMKVLEGALSSSMTSVAGPEFEMGVKTVRDLLELPREKLINSLQRLQSTKLDSSSELCDLLLDRCRGLDSSEVEDDGGGLPKTVSVENSFRRGTVRTVNDVWTELDELCTRLPRLLSDRASWSQDPSHAYPTTIRLTTRMIDSSQVGKRRPYVTRSKQTAIAGKVLMKGGGDAMEDENKQAAILKEWVTPLLQQLIPASADINLTRLNLAVTNFPDAGASIHQKQQQSPEGRLDFSQTSEKPMTKRPLHTSHEIDNKVQRDPRNMRLQIMPPPSKRKRNLTNLSSIAKQRSRTKTTRIDHFFFRKP